MTPPWTFKTRAEKSGLPTMAAIKGVMRSLTNELTMAVNAAPMMTATARPRTLPRRMKSRKPFNIGEPPKLVWALRAMSLAEGHRTEVRELSDLAANRDPVQIGVAEEEQDHADDHDVHVDTEDHAGVVEAPAALHAADGVDRADAGDDGRDDKQEVGTILGEVRQEESGDEGEQDHGAASDQRAA